MLTCVGAIIWKAHERRTNKVHEETDTDAARSKNVCDRTIKEVCSLV